MPDYHHLTSRLLAAPTKPRARVSRAAVAAHAATVAVAGGRGPEAAAAAAARAAPGPARHRVQGARVHEDDTAAEGAYEKW